MIPVNIINQYKNSSNQLIEYIEYKKKLIENKVEYKLGNTQDLINNTKEEKYLLSLKNNIKKILLININQINELVYLHGIFVDCIEDFYQLLYEEINIENDKNIKDKEYMDQYFLLISKYRKLNKKVTNIVDNIEDYINVKDHTYIVDNRLEMILTSINEKIKVEIKTNQKEYKFRKLDVILGISSLYICIFVFLFLMLNIFYFKSPFVVNNLKIILLTMIISFFVYIIFLIYSHIRILYLGSKMKDNVSAKYCYALYISIVFFFPQYSAKKYKYYIFECAEEDYLPALCKVGHFYQKGDGVKRDYELALNYYKKAFPYKKAKKRYERILKKIKGE